jgi:protein-disulfide isomerase
MRSLRLALPALLLLSACEHAPPAPVCPPAALAAPAVDARAEADRAREEALQAKLDLLITKVDDLEKKVEAGRAATGQRRGPDATAVYAIDITGDPFVGPADARVTIVKAQDYACPFCQRSEPTMAQLLKDYPGQVRVVYKDYIVHPTTATVPAHAACAAQAQGRFAEFNEQLWARAFGKDTGEAMMITIATDLKLDLARFAADMNGERCKEAAAADARILGAVGVSGTPSFFINGRFLSGARPLEQFKALVDEELTKANAAIGKNGVTAANYYAKVVLATGKKEL